MNSEDQLKNLGEIYINGLIKSNLESINNSLKELLLQAYMKGFKDASTLAYMKIHQKKNNDIK